MKKLVLTGKHLHLLLKVEENSVGFYGNVTDFLYENEEISDDEIVEIEVEDHVFNDIINVVTVYLKDSLGKEKPTPDEISALNELISQLKTKQEKESVEGNVEESAE